MRARSLRRTVSKTEARLWLHLRNGQIGASFRRQHPIGRFFADYACPEHHLVIEIDGPLHERRRDASHDAAMAKLGWTVLRFTLEDMDERIDSIVETIWQEIQLLRIRSASSP